MAPVRVGQPPGETGGGGLATTGPTELRAGKGRYGPMARLGIGVRRVFRSFSERGSASNLNGS